MQDGEGRARVLKFEGRNEKLRQQGAEGDKALAETEDAQQEASRGSEEPLPDVSRSGQPPGQHVCCPTGLSTAVARPSVHTFSRGGQFGPKPYSQCLCDVALCRRCFFQRNDRDFCAVDRLRVCSI